METRILKSGSVGDHPNFGFISVDTGLLHDGLLSCRSIGEDILAELDKLEKTKKIEPNATIRAKCGEITKTVMETLGWVDECKREDEIGSLLKEQAEIAPLPEKPAPGRPTEEELENFTKKPEETGEQQ